MKKRETIRTQYNEPWILSRSLFGGGGGEKNITS